MVSHTCGTHLRRRPGWASPCVLALIGTLLLAAAPHAGAHSTIKVAGTCTLQDAVAYADGTAEPGCASGTRTITLPASAAP